jgi:hypothetical protein
MEMSKKIIILSLVLCSAAQAFALESRVGLGNIDQRVVQFHAELLGKLKPVEDVVGELSENSRPRSFLFTKGSSYTQANQVLHLLELLKKNNTNKTCDDYLCKMNEFYHMHLHKYILEQPESLFSNEDKNKVLDGIHKMYQGPAASVMTQWAIRAFGVAQKETLTYQQKVCFLSYVFYSYRDRLMNSVKTSDISVVEAAANGFQKMIVCSCVPFSLAKLLLEICGKGFGVVKDVLSPFTHGLGLAVASAAITVAVSCLLTYNRKRIIDSLGDKFSKIMGNFFGNIQKELENYAKKTGIGGWPLKTLIYGAGIFGGVWKGRSAVRNFEETVTKNLNTVTGTTNGAITNVTNQWMEKVGNYL